jgi:hypothetical protein
MSTGRSGRIAPWKVVAVGVLALTITPGSIATAQNCAVCASCYTCGGSGSGGSFCAFGEGCCRQIGECNQTGPSLTTAAPENLRVVAYSGGVARLVRLRDDIFGWWDCSGRLLLAMSEVSATVLVELAVGAVAPLRSGAPNGGRT